MLQLRPDQRAAVDWLKHRTEAFVLLPIGFGKTIVTLTALKELNDVFVASGRPPYRTLVVSTKNIVNLTWGQEIERWGLPFSYQSAAGRRRKAVETRPDILGINFESLEWLLDLADADPSLLPEVLVIDESSKMKSPSANRVKRLIGRAPRKPGAPRLKPGELRGYVHKFARRFALSATPAPEGYTGLWSQHACISLRPRLGKNVTEFRQKFCTPHQVGPVVTWSCTQPQEEQIEAAISCVTYAPENRKYMDLPDPIFSDIEVPWSAAACKEYEQMEDEFLVSTEGETLDGVEDASLVEEAEDPDSAHVSAPNIAVQLNKLRQMCSGFVYDGAGRPIGMSDSDAKLLALDSILERTAESPVVVFTQFRAEASHIAARHRGAVVGLPSSLDDWNAGRTPMLILHPRNAGHGVNLHLGGCHTVVFYSLPWSFEEYDQAWGRLHRTGQTKQVSVLRLIRPESVETDLVVPALASKGRRQERFLENMRSRIEERIDERVRGSV